MYTQCHAAQREPGGDMSHKCIKRITRRMGYTIEPGCQYEITIIFKYDRCRRTPEICDKHNSKYYCKMDPEFTERK